jgi:hypothetical protein
MASGERRKCKNCHKLRAQGSILNSDSAAAIRRSRSRKTFDPLSQLTRPVSLPTRYDLQVRPPFQFFDHTGV